MRDIAREARVSTGAIHRHFRSKIELAHAVVHFRTLARQRSLDRLLAAHADPYARLAALVAMLGEEARRDPDSGCPALRLPTHLDRDGDAAEQRVSALARRLPRLVGRFVMDELAEAGLTLPDARLMSDAFVTTWQGSVVQVLLGEDGELSRASSARGSTTARTSSEHVV